MKPEEDKQPDVVGEVDESDFDLTAAMLHMLFHVGLVYLAIHFLVPGKQASALTFFAIGLFLMPSDEGRADDARFWLKLTLRSLVWPAILMMAVVQHLGKAGKGKKP